MLATPSSLMEKSDGDLRRKVHGCGMSRRIRAITSKYTLSGGSRPFAPQSHSRSYDARECVVRADDRCTRAILRVITASFAILSATGRRGELTVLLPNSGDTR